MNKISKKKKVTINRNRNNKVLSTLNKPVNKQFDGINSQVFRIPPKMNTADFLQSYGEIGWLFACVSKISESFADSEWQAFNGENQTQSKALNLLKKPNPFMSQYELLERHSMFMDLTGKSFWYISKDGINRPKEIWLINPMNMWIVPDKENYIKGYIYKVGAQEIPLDVDEVIFFNNPDPYNPYSGIGPAQAAAKALEIDKYSAEWNRNFFYNNAEPSGILTVPESLNDDSYERLKEQWKDQHQGVDNAKKMAILEGGMDYKSIQTSPKDMDFVNLRDKVRDEILRIFKVPETLLGGTESSNRASAETAEYSFGKNCLKPRLKKLQDKLNNELLPMFGEQGIELKFTDPVPENKEFISQVILDNVDKTITKNEARVMLNKILGTKLIDIADGDVIYQATTLQPLGTLPTISTPSPSIDTTETTKSFQKKGISKTIKKRIAVQVNKNNKDRHEQFEKTVQPLEKEFTSTIKDYFLDMKQEVINNVSNKEKNPVDVGKWNKELQSRVSEIYVKCFKAAGDSTANEFKSIGNYIKKDLGISFNLKNPQVKKAIQNKVIKIKDINQTTSDNIRKLLDDNDKDETFTVGDLTKAIKDSFTFSDARAETIAQTEVISSLNQGTSLAYKQNSDVIDGKCWLSTDDGTTRESHMQAGEDYSEDNPINVDEQFTVGDCSCDCPGDSSLPPEECINCRCTITPYINVN